MQMACVCSQRVGSSWQPLARDIWTHDGYFNKILVFMVLICCPTHGYNQLTQVTELPALACTASCRPAATHTLSKVKDSSSQEGEAPQLQTMRRNTLGAQARHPERTCCQTSACVQKGLCRTC